MDVGSYVSQLLDDLNEVSLRGIGTFHHKYVPAFFDQKQGIFFPPSKKIVFDDSSADISAGLIEKITSERKISEPSARYFAEKYCETIKQSLQIKGYAEISQIGKLRMNDGHLLFEPLSAEKDAFNYGLTPVTELGSVRLNAMEPDLSAIRRKNTEDTPLPEAEESVSRSNKTGVLIFLTLILVAGTAGILYFYYPNFFNLDRFSVQKGIHIKPEGAAVVKPTLDDSIRKADSIMQSSFAEMEKDGITVEKPKDTLNIRASSSPLKDSAASSNPVIRYEIICASFNRQSEAETSVAIFRKRGIDARIIKDSKKPFYKISLGSFTDSEAATKERRRIQKDIIKDAWILTLENK